MNTELVVSSSETGMRVGLLQDGQLLEFHDEDESNNFTVGDLFLGTVKKVVPGLNAAFIDVGYEKDAFLHYLDLGPQFRSLQKYGRLVQSKKMKSSKLTDFSLEQDINKLGKINQVLSKNQKVVVQIVKEPISNKGPRLSCEISIPGRYIVLVPFNNTVSVSRKITSSDERNRLKRLITSIKPDNFGVIIRTVAEGKDVKELDRDLRNLTKAWDDGYYKLKSAKPRDKIIGETNRAHTVIRDLMNESFDSIITDNKEIHDDIKSYIKRIAPEKEKIVKFHGGKQKLFEQKGIEKQLKVLFGKSVGLPGGGYLIIEHTEALHVIDVNSGNKSNQESDQETTAKNTNLLAVKEIARQLRLRDMGGIIVADFIDMRNADNRKLIFDTMREEMKRDKAKSVILPLSKFGLLQITRQRVRPELNIATKETCPQCQGSGKIQASIIIVDEIENTIDHVLTKQNEKKVTLVVHPYLYAYFTKGLFSIRWNWFMKYKKWVRVVKDTSLGIVEYQLLNNVGEEIEV